MSVSETLVRVYASECVNMCECASECECEGVSVTVSLCGDVSVCRCLIQIVSLTPGNHINLKFLSLSLTMHDVICKDIPFYFLHLLISLCSRLFFLASTYWCSDRILGTGYVKIDVTSP